MALPGPTHIPPIGPQTDPDQARVAAVVGGQLASAPARGFGLTPQELGNLQAITAGYLTTAETRNRVVNGNFCISQENGNVAGTATPYYVADQWYVSASTSGTITKQRVQSVTPNGSKDRIRVTITVADAALAATDNLYINSAIEGIRTADFRYGSASAKQSIMRFGFKGPAGTYTFNIQNHPGTRSYLANFTISAGQANTDTEQVFVIPGDTTGTWFTDTQGGLWLAITLAAGTTYQSTVGWSAGSFYGTATTSNGMATAGAVYELFDAALYLDPLATGVAPRWTMPDEAQELAACKRYWSPYPTYRVDTSAFSCIIIHPTEMRVAPAWTGGGAGFGTAGNSTILVQVYQTTANYQQLVANARM